MAKACRVRNQLAWFACRSFLTLSAGLLCLAATSSARQEHPPKVKVLSPELVAYVPLESKENLYVSIEITDVDGFGLDLDNSGVPRFYDTNENGELLRKGIVGKSKYTNSKNQTVIHVVSKVSIERLVREEKNRITPPIDAGALSEEQKKAGYEIPGELAIEFAPFMFSVRDTRGVNSQRADKDIPDLMVAFYSVPFRPTAEPQAPSR